MQIPPARSQQVKTIIFRQRWCLQESD